MAIEFDTSTGASGNTSTDPFNASTSVTVASNNNRIMLCAIVTGTNSTIGTPAYDSSNFTILSSGTANTRAYSVGYLVAPSTGANNFTVTLDRQAGSEFSYAYSIYVYYNVDQSSPIDSSSFDDLTFGDSLATTSNTAGGNNTLSWSTAFCTADDTTGASETLGGNNTRTDQNTANEDTRVSSGDYGVDASPTSRTGAVNLGGAGNPSTGSGVVALTPSVDFIPKAMIF